MTVRGPFLPLIKFIQDGQDGDLPLSLHKIVPVNLEKNIPILEIWGTEKVLDKYTQIVYTTQALAESISNTQLTDVHRSMSGDHCIMYRIDTLESPPLNFLKAASQLYLELHFEMYYEINGQKFKSIADARTGAMQTTDLLSQ